MIKKISITLSIIIIAIGVFFSILNVTKSTSKITHSLEPFHETLKEPSSLSVVDYSMRQEGSSGKISREERYKISVLVEDYETIEKITNMLNDKSVETIEPSEFYMCYENIGDKVRFHIEAAVDGNVSSKYYHPYNIFILNDYTLYIQSRKGTEVRCLKSSVTSDEYEYIYNLYSSLPKKK
ncbi:hypothetical protein [Terrisporobacter vanillatitrophus]|uniref:hypothetical protein n=1 Tax=Terrisporobacter vanillatitrophus TaxID=3058402 RepID=UPI0033695241